MCGLVPAEILHKDQRRDSDNHTRPQALVHGVSWLAGGGQMSVIDVHDFYRWNLYT